MTEDKVTIGIPVFNEEKYLEKTLYSALSQTYKNVEIIISDNCSEDNSSEIIKQISNKNIKYYIQPKNISAIDNFNFLLDKCTSNYFMFLGGHDFISDNYVEACIHRLQDDPNTILSSPRVFRQTTPLGVYRDNFETLNTIDMPARLAILQWLWQCCSCFQFYGVFRTNILRKVGIPKIYSSDIYAIAVSLLHGSAAHCSEAIYFATCNRPQESISESIERYNYINTTRDTYLKYINKPNSAPYYFLNKPCEKEIINSVKKSPLTFIEKIYLKHEIRKIFKTRFSFKISNNK
jgi:glycosyltransferase involved in cell wall biosynthesis